MTVIKFTAKAYTQIGELIRLPPGSQVLEGL